ncbi:hypothetical protein [Arthrobacter sp. Leaf234]|uniref:hypothetical protein n=1 Tax=Arthrobacter sp. Leaf234 TaxID=1736303 RepID=UPI0012FAE550|nr:hypothetical protein [Arthrobacter sp. Leaf234]
MNRTKKFLVSAAALGFVAATISPAAAADDGPDVLDALQTVDAIQGKPATMDVLSEVAQVSAFDDANLNATTEVGDVTVTVPSSTADDLGLKSTSGRSVQVSLPFPDTAAPAEEVADGIVEYDNENGSSTVPILKEDGSVQVTTIIDGPSAPSTYAYEFDLADGQYLELQDNGSVAIFNADRSFGGGIAAAWATDAAGASVQTSYSISGSTLTQTVLHSEQDSYPVVADPWLGVDLISYHRWPTTQSISVHVTPWMGTVSSGVAGSAGWDELKTKVRAGGVGRYNELMRTTYYDQWSCHSVGKVAIFAGQVTGMDKNSSWDLEGTRAPNGNFATWVSRRCNW